MSQTPPEAFSKAIGYAWGMENGTGEPTATPDGHILGSYAFAEAYRLRQVAYNQEKTFWMPALVDAYEAWQDEHGKPVWTDPRSNRTRAPRLSLDQRVTLAVETLNEDKE